MSNVQTLVKPARAEPLLELMVDADKRGQVDSRTPVRWCVGRPMLSKLEEVGFKNPYIVIVVRNRRSINEYHQQFRVWRDTAIYACPLTQELQYINFKAPGRNDVRAFVVEMNSKTAAWLRVTRRNINDGQSDSIFQENGRLASGQLYSGHRTFSVTYFDTSARVRVVVPKEMFAAEPAAWRRNLVRAYGMGRGGDQCGFRRRFWFGAVPPTLIGIPLLFYIPKLIALLLYTFFGYMPNKGFWRAAANPLNFMSWKNSLRGFSESKWWNGEQSIVLGVLNPPVLLITPCVVWCIMHLPLHHYHVKGHSHHSAWYPMSWPHVVMWVDGFIVGVMAALAVIAGIGILLIAAVGALAQKHPAHAARLEKFLEARADWASSRWKQWRANVKQRRLERAQRAKLRLEAELVEMTCRSEAFRVDLAALPKEKQTVYLRFSYIKTKVCRPFAA